MNEVENYLLKVQLNKGISMSSYQGVFGKYFPDTHKEKIKSLKDLYENIYLR